MTTWTCCASPMPVEQRREKLDVPALSKLTEGLEKFNPDEQARLLGGLAESYLQSGEPEKCGPCGIN